MQENCQTPFVLNQTRLHPSSVDPEDTEIRGFTFTKILPILMFLCGFLFFIPSQSLADYIVANISNNIESDDESPRINENGWVTWEGSSKVFLYNGKTVKQLNWNDEGDRTPVINSHGWVAWCGAIYYDDSTGHRHWPPEILLYNGTTIKRLTDNIDSDFDPDINDSGWVTWVRGYSDSQEIFLYNGTAIKQLTDNIYEDANPKINNKGWVTWVGKDGNDQEIFLYNGITTNQLTDNSYEKYGPKINDKGWVTWIGKDGNDQEIFLYNGTTVKQLTDNNYDDYFPMINDKGWVTWVGYGTDYNFVIFLYNGATVKQIASNTYIDQPMINNKGWITWCGTDSYFNSDIFLYNGNTVTQITNTGDNYDHPQINDNGSIVWRNGAGSHEIILAKHFDPIPSTRTTKVPDTGQTKCYDNAGEISCPNAGEPFYGQDAHYTFNPPSYTKMENSGKALPDSATSWVMVRDNVTGLIWEVKNNNDNVISYANPHDADNIYTWYDPTDAYPGRQGDGTDTQDFIDALNNEHFGGYTDWRMPTIKELTTIINYNILISGQTIDTTYFPDNESSKYWSSTIDARDAGDAWGVDFTHGYFFAEDKFFDFIHNVQTKHYVQAVRGGQPESFSHLKINGDGTVTDTETGLMWQQANAPGTYTWQQALVYAENLNLANHTDWRLPNVRELLSLVDYHSFGPALDPMYFPETASNYWSSSNIDQGDIAWTVGFLYGGRPVDSFKCRNGYVRAVRNDQGGALVNSPSSLSVMATSSAQIVLGWRDNSNNETGFKIERKTGNCSSTNVWGEIVAKSANATTHTIAGLLPNTTYAFRVIAYQSSTNSTYSNCVFAKTGPRDTPPSPTNLTATSASSTRINLSWRDNSTIETGFKIYRKAGPGVWTLIKTTGANAVSYSDITAPNNSSTIPYQYFAADYNASGNSPSTYAAIVPYQPINLNAASGSAAGAIKLTWTDKSSNETGFEIYRKSGACSSASAWARVTIVGANKATWTDTGRTSGSKYSYRIRAYTKSGAVLSAYGYSLWSACKEATAP